MRNSDRSCIRISLIATAVVVLSLNSVAFAGDPPPPVPGVCCAPGGGPGCQDTLNVFADCYEMERPFIIGVTCDQNPCGGPVTGACCFAGATCQAGYTAADCANEEGSYQGDGTDCTPNPCEAPTEACCFSDGTCDLLTATQCGSAGGVNHGGHFCIDVPCGVGACCTTVSCFEANAYNCIIDGYLHQGTGTLCTPNPCGSFLQACCYEDSTCQDLTFTDCAESGGTPQGEGSTCEEADCGTVACCLPEEGCQLLSAGACGAQGGVLLGGASCTPNPCATGACCVVSSCVPSDAHTCISNGHSFNGAGSVCSPGLCAQPCVCINDVNHDFTYNALDIQAFVNCATGVSEDCSCADNTFDGQTTPADIPSFINSIMNTTGECL